MIRALYLICMCLVIEFVYGQTAVFSEYNFEDGGYALVALYSETSKNSLADSMGSWYIDDIATLNEFKKEWVFKVPGKMRACGYDYELVLTKNGQSLQSLHLTLDCSEIVSGRKYFYFEPQKLKMFKGKVKPLKPVDKTVETLEEARTYRDNILKNPNLLLVDAPLWTKFDGQFEFGYYCKNPEVCLGNWNAFKQLFREELLEYYPGEEFELQLNGGHEHNINLQVICNRNLGEIYKLHGREITESPWKPFKDIKITSWWKGN